MPQLFTLVKQSMWDRDQLSIFGFHPLIFRTDSDINVFSTLHFSCMSLHILSSWGALCFIFPFHFICGHCMIWNTLHNNQKCDLLAGRRLCQPPCASTWCRWLCKLWLVQAFHLAGRVFGVMWTWWEAIIVQKRWRPWWFQNEFSWLSDYVKGDDVDGNHRMYLTVEEVFSQLGAPVDFNFLCNIDAVELVKDGG